MNVLKALASIIYIYSLYVIFFTENYTEIFYKTDEGDIPSIQCKMSLRGPMFMRKVGGLSLIFNDFYVLSIIPLRPRCSFLRTQPSSWSVAYIQVSSPKKPRQTPAVWGISFICILYSVGNRTETCGTPACISLGV
jgi:hypothetical protein